MNTSQGNSSSTRVRYTVSTTTPVLPLRASAKAADPPITNTEARSATPPKASKAPPSEEATSTSSGMPSAALTPATSLEDVNTTFKRPFKGRNLAGILDHVFLPITTALR